MKLVIILLYSYLLGAIPFGYLLSRFRYHIDIRKKGSGNIGATNVVRVIGVLPGFIVLILDACKGYLSIKITQLYGPQYIYISGLMAIIGHCWPVYLKFKGGKGVATTIGVLLGLNPLYLVYVIMIFLPVFVVTRIVSISSLLSAIGLPLIVYFKHHNLQPVYMLSIYSIIIIYRHKPNILRLFQGKEKKISFRKRT